MNEMTTQNGGGQVSRMGIEAQARMTAPASQATTIEQSRAIAQVRGALMVAQQCPRDEQDAIARIRQTCQIMAVAERAFFSYKRGGQTVTGGSIHLAAELARCWGNIDFGIAELARDDVKGESEMLAVAWDLETNTRVNNTFLVPHRRDKRNVKGGEPITDMRDIYENNANMGARRLRECIFRVLPPWLIEEAKSMCHTTLKEGGGVPLVKRIADCLAAFDKIGVSRDQIETRLGKSADRMNETEVANLRILWQSIHRGEMNKDEEFPKQHAKDIQASLQQQAAETPAAPPSSEAAGQEGGGADSVAAPPPSEPKEKRPPKTQLDAVAKLIGEAQSLDDLAEIEFDLGSGQFKLGAEDEKAARQMLRQRADLIKG